MVMLLLSPSNQILSLKRRRSALEVVGVMIKAHLACGAAIPVIHEQGANDGARIAMRARPEYLGGDRLLILRLRRAYQDQGWHLT